jgi:hypothetical protein
MRESEKREKKRSDKGGKRGMRMREEEGNLILRIKNGSSGESHILEIFSTC